MTPYSRIAGIHIATALCLAAAAAGVRPSRERQAVRYREFCGPPNPASRQHRRALFRASAKALASLSTHEGNSQ